MDIDEMILGTELENEETYLTLNEIIHDLIEDYVLFGNSTKSECLTEISDLLDKAKASIRVGDDNNV